MPVRHSIGFRQLLLWHVKGAEDKIENGKRRGEVPFAALLGCGVVPTVEHRTGDQVPERPESPVQIGVNESRMRDGEWPQKNQDIRRNAGEEEHYVNRYAAKKDIDRMETRSRYPVEVFGGMMHRVILPKQRPMEGAMY